MTILSGAYVTTLVVTMTAAAGVAIVLVTALDAPFRRRRVSPARPAA